MSGLFADRFVFYGFLPLKKGKRKKALEGLCSSPYPIVFYESPRRVEETLGYVLDIMGDRKMVMVKEMTKLFERTFRGTVSEVIAEVSEKRENLYSRLKRNMILVDPFRFLLNTGFQSIIMVTGS